MRRRSIVWLFWIFAMACGQTLTPPGDDPQGTSDGGGTPDDAAGSDAAPGDAGAADAEPGCMTNPVEVPFSDPRWLTGGDAVRQSEDVVLTPATPQKTGVVQWSQRRRLSDVKVDLTVVLGRDSKFGDGFVVTFLDVASVPVLGGPGGNMGACGVGGFGVAIDTQPDPDGDLSAGHRIKVFSLSTDEGCPDEPYVAVAAPAALTNGQPHELSVTLSAKGEVTVAADGMIVVSAYPLFEISGFMAFDGYVGFSAANGGGSGEHLVRAPRISFTSEPPCP